MVTLRDMKRFGWPLREAQTHAINMKIYDHYPVIHLDFSEIAYSTAGELKFSLDKFIELTAEKSNVVIDKELPLSMKFSYLIEQLHKKTNNPVVALIDEYDKPLIDNLDKETYSEIKRTLHDFYQVIKSSDEHLKFVFLIGVSQFSGLSIFSGLNNLNDITMDSEYGTICGYTQEELESNFREYIDKTAKAMDMAREDLLLEIRKWYNGYSWEGKTSVYNPFSTLMFFNKGEFSNYWFATGTPTFLIEQIKKKDDLESFARSREVEIESLRGSGNNTIESIALLFQTGYLTVKKKKIGADYTPQYTIDFPNMEVRKAFIGNLLEEYIKKDPSEVQSINSILEKALEEKNEESLEKGLTELFANIPYNLTIKKESYYHSLFLLAARMSGYEVEGEVHTDKGRIDAVLRKDGRVIIVEIKYSEEKTTSKMIEEAMGQIRDKKYYEKYIGNDISLLAITFSDKKEIGCKFQTLI
jgi:Holliday junction resolvase-like predicted endonuclease